MRNLVDFFEIALLQRDIDSSGYFVGMYAVGVSENVRHLICAYLRRTRGCKKAVLWWCRRRGSVRKGKRNMSVAVGPESCPAIETDRYVQVGRSEFPSSVMHFKLRAKTNIEEFD
jgi:hypothetical protein